MKKFVLFLVLVFSAACSFSQDSNPAKATYLRFPTIPPFTLLKIDSASLTKNDLSKHKKTLLMYFSPECDHCKHQTKDMLSNIDKFQDVQIVMATYQPFEEMLAFYKDYQIASYPNIRMGRDTKYFFPPFFKMGSLPFLALYNDKGKLLTTFEGTTPVSKLIDAFKADNALKAN